MLKMRLQRIGRKNDPSFRVVVTDSRRGPKSGKNVDLIGSYSPKLDQIQIDGEKAKTWISKGVQVSDTVHNLLVSQKIIDGAKRNVLPKKTPIVSEAAEEAEAAPAEATGPEGDAASESSEEASAEAASEESTEEAASAEEVTEDKKDAEVSDAAPEGEDATKEAEETKAA